MQAQSVAVGDV